jgi:hypothetical protein
MSCATKDCRFGNDPVTRLVAETPTKTVFEWKYVKDKPVEILDNGQEVRFWITPKYREIFYSTCRYGEQAAIDECISCKGDTTEKTYYTGLLGKDAAQSQGLFCYGNACPFAPAAVCGKIITPRISAGYFALTIPIGVEYNADKSIKYVYVKAPGNAVDSYNSFMYVLNNTYDGKNETRFIPKEIAIHWFRRYCERDPEKKGCDLLRTEAPELYKEIVNKYCKDDKLPRGICKTYCTDKNTKCDQRIQEYCKKLGPREALKRENSELCGCFMGNDFYKGYFDEIRKRYNFPITAPPSHVCYFDYCSTSNIKPYFEKQNPTRCPDVLSCFQNANVTINSTGQVETGDIIINQSQVCQQAIQRKCKVQEDCKTVPGSICTQGICKRTDQSPSPPGPPQPPQQESCKTDKDCRTHSSYCIDSKCKKLNKEQCFTNNQCSPGTSCLNGKCIVSPSWNKTIIIISIIVAVLTAIVMFT